MEVKRLIGEFTNENLVVINTDRHYELPSDLRMKSEAFWQDFLEKARARNQEVWEGIVYRLEKIERTHGDYKIYLGTLGYKDNIATSFLRDDLANRDFDKRPNGMYVCAFLRTSDNKYIFGIKNLEGVTRIKVIGGILNQDEHKVESVEDLFAAFYEELKEETDLKKTYCLNMRGLGIFQMPTTRINVCLYGELALTLEQFTLRAKPNYEHDAFVGLTKKEILENQLIDEGVKKVFKYVK